MVALFDSVLNIYVLRLRATESLKVVKDDGKFRCDQ